MFSLFTKNKNEVKRLDDQPEEVFDNGYKYVRQDLIPKGSKKIIQKTVKLEVVAPDWKDLTVMEVLNIFDPAENDEDSQRAELAKDLVVEFKYSNLSQKLETEELKSVLIKAGIPLLDNKAVEKYKKDMVKFKRATQSETDDWKWLWYDLNDVYTGDVPEAILKTALRVKKAVKDSNIPVADVIIAVVELVNDEDPFIFVERKLCEKNYHMCGGNGWHTNMTNPFYFGVWNEKAFNGKYFLPESKEATDIQSEIDDL